MTDAALEPADRRRLMEAHLREQMAAEMDEQGRQRYAEGYADGIRRRGEGTPD